MPRRSRPIGARISAKPWGPDLVVPRFLATHPFGLVLPRFLAEFFFFVGCFGCYVVFSFLLVSFLFLNPGADRRSAVSGFEPAAAAFAQVSVEKRRKARAQELLLYYTMTINMMYL